MDNVKETPAGPAFAPGRRRATCSNCRRRKSKCDNRQPQCSTCIAHNSQCQYDKPPSLAYVRSLEAKIESLLQERGTLNSANSVTSKSRLQSQSVSDPRETASAHGHYVERTQESPGARDQWVSEISVDSNGGVCYHNPTSAIHEAPSDNPRSNSVCASSPETISVISEVGTQQMDQIKQSLVSNAAAQRRFEAMAVENMAAVPNEISSEMASEFLKLHWCWIHPMFMFVYRPAFTRDMAMSHPTRPETPYFSETLLKVIFAHSARFLVKNALGQDQANILMDTLLEQARFSLAMRISMPSSIPTIQALLQQSAREVAFGNSSQAWLYSGMAFRIATDLGIHLPSDKLRGYVRTLTAEDIEIRKRLFWSCYTWDKAISLYLGRMPAFTPVMESDVPVFMDDFTENDPWEPFYGSGGQRDMNTRATYPPQRGHVVSCFTALCSLSTILSTIMFEIYGSSPTQDGQASAEPQGHVRTPNSKSSSFVKISTAVQQWWTELPDFIRLNVKSLPKLSPPLHILSLNLLYNTTLILLHRPFILGAREFNSPAVSRSYQICVTAAAAIHDLLELLTATFGYSHITYLNCYSTYIAATIAVLHFEHQEESRVLPELGVANDKLGLKFFLGVLQRTATAMPALSRSVEIVKRHMQAIVERRSKQYLESLFPEENTVEIPTPEQSSATGPSPGSFQLPSQAEQFKMSSAQSRNVPNLEQSTTESMYPLYSGFNLKGLPAFPGQNLNVGADCTLDQAITDPEMRTTLLGLDPHVTLHHENSDWAYDGFYMGGDIE